MRIRGFLHKGLRRLYAEDNPKGLPPEAVGKIRKMLAFLQDMESADELRTIAVWKAHQMSGGDWRLTFTVDTAENEILDVNYEDYH